MYLIFLLKIVSRIDMFVGLIFLEPFFSFSFHFQVILKLFDMLFIDSDMIAVF